MRLQPWIALAVAPGLMSAVRRGAEAQPGRNPTEAPAPGLAEIARLDLLPRCKASVKVASISSYDRTGGNDVGFSGRYSFLRNECDGLVIADLQGPGVIYRIWTPTPYGRTYRVLLRRRGAATRQNEIP